MGEYLINGETLASIADAVREKASITNAMFPADMPGYIRSIRTSSSDGAPDDIVAEARRVSNAMIPKIGTDAVTFIAVSDMHEMGDNDHSDSAVIEKYRRANQNAGQGAKIISNLVPLDFFVNLGDLAWGSSSTTTHDLISSMVNARNYTFGVDAAESFFTPGNHDVDSASGFIDPAVVTGLAGNYRCVDFPSKKVRVICLNTADTTDGTTGTERVSGEQLQWFAESLDLSTKSDVSEWGIIVLSHHSLDWGAVKPLANCLAAYLTGVPYSATHDGVSVSYDFTGKNAATFIANFHGHVHCFKVANISGTTAQRVAIPNACFGRNNEYGTSGNTEFGETATYNKSDNSTGKNTAFCLVSVDLSKKIIYADCFGAGYDRVISYGVGEIVTHTVTSNLSNAVNNNTAESVVDGTAYAAIITAHSGYEIDMVTVTMGGVDITSTAYSGGVISIPNVTGDIVITVTTTVTETPVTYTNLVPTSLDYDLDGIFNGTGYKNGYYASTDAPYYKSDSVGSVITGLIPYDIMGDNDGYCMPPVIYIKGVTFDTAQSHNRLAVFREDTKVVYSTQTVANLSKYFSIETLGTQYYKLTPIMDGNGRNMLAATWGVQNITHIAISANGDGANMVVTYDEPIE